MMSEEEQNKVLDELEGRIEKLKSEMGELTTELEEKEDRINDLTTALEHAEAVIEQAAGKLRWYERK